MCDTKSEDQPDFSETEEEVAARAYGKEVGDHAGSWVIDGNTDEATCRRLVDGFEHGDPEVMEMEPSPLSGEWADGLTENDVYVKAGVTPDAEPEFLAVVIEAFDDGFSTAYWETVTEAARHQLGLHLCPKHDASADNLDAAR